MTRIIGNHDGPSGRNESYNVSKRKNIKRTVIVKEIKQGIHPGAHVIKVNNREYARDNPDGSTSDNVDRNK